MVYGFSYKLLKNKVRTNNRTKIQCYIDFNSGSNGTKQTSDASQLLGLH